MSLIPRWEYMTDDAKAIEALKSNHYQYFMTQYKELFLPSRENFESTLASISRVSKIQTIYDVGANEGRWTRDLSSKFPYLDFYMFEANPSLKKPLDLNHKWFNVLLSSEDDLKIVFYSKNSTGDSYYKESTGFYEEDVQEISLASRSLDSFVQENNLPMPDVIKMDTQGSELDIIQGAYNCIKSCKLIICEVPIIQFNKGAPLISDYLRAFAKEDFIPTGLDKLHYMANMLIFVDMVFMKRSIRDSLYGHSSFIDRIQ